MITLEQRTELSELALEWALAYGNQIAQIYSGSVDDHKAAAAANRQAQEKFNAALNGVTDYSQEPVS